MILAEKIMRLRKQQGWSQEDLAVRLDISRQSVSKWESGASIPDLDKIIKISDLFGVSTDFLLKDEMDEIPATAIRSEEPVLTITKTVDAANAKVHTDAVSAAGAKDQLYNFDGSKSGKPQETADIVSAEPSETGGAVCNAQGAGTENKGIGAGNAAWSDQGAGTGNKGAGSRINIKERKVLLDEANRFMEIVEQVARKIAIGVAMCILSPVMLIFLAGLAESGETNIADKWITENAAAGFGVTILLLMVAGGVALIVFNSARLKKFEYLEHDLLELEYGIAGIVERKMEAFEPVRKRCLTAGVALCISCAVPLMMAVAFDSGEMVTVFCVDMILILVSFGVYMFIWSGMIQGSYEKLLEEGDYTREKKIENKKNENLSKVYWGAVIAIFLGYSFVSMNWHISWVIWPCAGVLYGVVCGVAAMIRR